MTKTDEELKSFYEDKLKQIKAREDSRVLRYLKNQKNESGETEYDRILVLANSWEEDRRKSRKSKSENSDQDSGSYTDVPSGVC